MTISLVSPGERTLTQTVETFADKLGGVGRGEGRGILRAVVKSCCFPSSFQPFDMAWLIFFKPRVYGLREEMQWASILPLAMGTVSILPACRAVLCTVRTTGLRGFLPISVLKKSLLSPWHLNCKRALNFFQEGITALTFREITRGTNQPILCITSSPSRC